LIVPVDPPPQRWIEILDPTSGNRVVTVIEIFSPTNKDPLRGRAQYLQKQKDYLEGGINLVEIDLLLSGQSTAAFDPAVFEERTPPHYLVCVRRATTPTRAELYTISLRQRLPRVRIPLRPDDDDVSLDLQAVVTECYDKGRYDRLDYTRELPSRCLSGDDAAWIERLVAEAKPPPAEADAGSTTERGGPME
jgi:hypothetical protein